MSQSTSRKAQTTSRKRIQEAARLFNVGTTKAEIARKMGVDKTTMTRWGKTQEWQEEIARLNTIVRETTVQVTQEHKQAYRSELLRSRDLLRDVNDQQLQSAMAFAMAARSATEAILRDCEPEDAAERLAKGGAAYLANVASNMVEAAGKQIDRLYAVAQVLEHIETLL